MGLVASGGGEEGGGRDGTGVVGRSENKIRSPLHKVARAHFGAMLLSSWNLAGFSFPATAQSGGVLGLGGSKLKMDDDWFTGVDYYLDGPDKVG